MDRLRTNLANLRAALPEREAALIGWPAILGYLNDTLQLRTRWGTPVSSNVALRWVRELGMPLARGCRAFRGSKGWAPHSQVWSTTFLLASWVASLFSTGERGPFTIAQEGELRNS